MLSFNKTSAFLLQSISDTTVVTSLSTRRVILFTICPLLWPKSTFKKFKIHGKQQISPFFSSKKRTTDLLYVYSTAAFCLFTDPFITTPGNSFGLGKVHGSGSGGPSKLISTSPIPSVVGGCPSPTLMTAASTRQTATVTGQHSLLPVPHSPMLADGGPAFFGGANTGSAGGWLAGASGMHYPEGHPNM